MEENDTITMCAYITYAQQNGSVHASMCVCIYIYRRVFTLMHALFYFMDDGDTSPRDVCCKGVGGIQSKGKESGIHDQTIYTNTLCTSPCLQSHACIMHQLHVLDYIGTKNIHACKMEFSEMPPGSTFHIAEIVQLWLNYYVYRPKVSFSPAMKWWMIK